MLERCFSVREKHKPISLRWWNNCPTLVRIALRLLRSSELTVRQSDKDSGFTVATRADLALARARAMPPSKYTPIPLYTLNIIGIKQSFSKLVRRIAEAVERPELVRAFYSGQSFREPADLVLPVVENIKTHKPPGQISCRIIHAGHRFQFSTIGVWISYLVRPALAECTHLLLAART